uniref:C-CAP/cofactor C-like domain-containing protein n=1 Tax=Macrostomum lignano TaxID=282301 RepID=A0A1I8HNT7_9PLAT
MRFGPFCFYYPELLGQFENSSLSPFNCHWSEIHDFTPGTPIRDFFPLDVPESHQLHSFISQKVSTKPEYSVVPQTFGSRPAGLTDEKCLALVFSGWENAVALIAKAATKPDLRLVRTWQLQLTVENGRRLLQTMHYDAQLAKGPVICLEFNGPQVVPLLQSLTQGNEDFYVSSDSGVADRQLDILGGIVDMQMNSQ